MFDKIKALWARVKISWTVVTAAIIAALPYLLDWLGIVDLTPILSRFLSESWVTLIVGILPFVLAFLKPMVTLSATEEA